MLRLKTRQAQSQICERWGVCCMPPDANQKVGVAANVREGLLPVHGLRHPPEGDTCGWYIWAGEEPSGRDDFFLPLHVSHLDEWRPEIVKYLGLPPGWRFLVAPDHEDIWYDPSLLEI